MKVSYPVDSFDKRMCPLGIIFSFWELTRQTTVSADPPVPADIQNTCENHLSILIGKNRPAFSAIFCVNCGQMSFIVRLLSRFMA